VTNSELAPNQYHRCLQNALPSKAKAFTKVSQINGTYISQSYITIKFNKDLRVLRSIFSLKRPMS